jgi:hypothetical protein
MYIVKLKERPDSDEIVVHSPFVNGVKLVSGSITQGVNDIDSFDLEMDFSNPGYNHIKPMQTLIEVINITNNVTEFSGRLVNYIDTMGSDGLHTKTAICEGTSGYLHDSYPMYIDESLSPEDLFERLIGMHNGQVEVYKQFYFGVVALNTTIDKNGKSTYVNPNITTTSAPRFITPEQTIYDAIKANLLDVYGGEIQTRSIGDKCYIDYVQHIGHDSDEDIGISRNLRSVTKKVDPSSIVTRLIPLGKTISTTSETDNEKRLTIASVNSNLLYLDRADLISEFGIQMGSVTWDDITVASTLKTTGTDWLNKQKVVLEQYTVEALDLFKIGKGVEEYIVGNTHKIVNPIMSINERIRIVTKQVDIVDPVNSSLTIGDKFKTLIDYQKEQRQASKNYANLQALVSQQRATIDSLSGQVSSVQTTLTNTSVDTLPSDLQEINLKLDNIQRDIDNLPTYDVATSTSDGLMSSSDKIKSDKITVTNVVNLDSVTNKTDKITVVNAVDLDNLVARITALENQTP